MENRPRSNIGSNWGMEFPCDLPRTEVLVPYSLSINLLFHWAMNSVISQNGTSPSECQHFSCWYTKGQFGLKCPKHYRWASPLMHFP